MVDFGLAFSRRPTHGARNDPGVSHVLRPAAVVIDVGRLTLARAVGFNKPAWKDRASQLCRDGWSNSLGGGWARQSSRHTYLAQLNGRA